ncbi:MAG: ATP-binding protein [Candidatus Electryonea clarkiae]|nr:ATP-binding protein [Candidatus Electryonea clarkiae]MDP8289293.1 ATP-binding protein [Candidatus Electryonea clarkiae]
MEDKFHIHLTLPMLNRMELVASSVSETLAEMMAFDEERSQEISMALIEACINAFEHSNGDDKNIYLTFHAENDIMKITVSDHGNGFDPARVEQPDIKNQLKPGAKKRGWGLKVMDSMMDSVQIQSDNNGTTVTLIKKKDLFFKEGS